MGIVLARFRKKLSTKEQLEKIQQEIERLEDYKWSTLRSQKNIIGLLFFVSGLIYFLVAFTFYFYYLPRADSWQDKVVHAVPLIILPALVYLLKRALQWYYRWDLDSKEDKLITLRKDKKKILVKVMETETYKVAKELLEKYDPSALKEKPSPRSGLETSLAATGGSGSHLRYRTNTPNSSFLQKSPAPRYDLKALTPAVLPPGTSGFPHRSPLPPPLPRLARPIMQPNRGVVEKLVDYVVGDGPSNRYALICNVCKSHNGMALKEEFEYIAFRCCYCFAFNPARKQRPFAPRLLPEAIQGPKVDEPESDSETPKPSADGESSVNIVELSSPEASATTTATTTMEQNDDNTQSEEAAEATSTEEEAARDSEAPSLDCDDKPVLM